MIVRCCVSCGTPRIIHCTEDQWRAWAGGALIQKAMPHVPREEREMLLSGICSTCWRMEFTPPEGQDGNQ